MQPTNEQLEQKVWYRISKVLAYLVFGCSFIISFGVFISLYERPTITKQEGLLRCDDGQEYSEPLYRAIIREGKAKDIPIESQLKAICEYGEVRVPIPETINYGHYNVKYYNVAPALAIAIPVVIALFVPLITWVFIRSFRWILLYIVYGRNIPLAEKSQ